MSHSDGSPPIFDAIAEELSGPTRPRNPRQSFGKVLGVKDAHRLDLPGLNFEQLAAGFGLHATRVSTHSELADAVNRVPAAGPGLLNVLVEPAADALY